MKNRRKKGFITILVMASLGVLILITMAIAGIGANELLQTKLHNDSIAAYYAAYAGAENMYTILKSKTNSTVNWAEQVLTNHSVSYGGVAVGTFTAKATSISYTSSTDKGVFGIASEGTMNGHKVRITVKYGYSATSTTAASLGSVGPIVLQAHQDGKKDSTINVDGPLESASSITIGSPTSLVTVNGSTYPNESGLSPVSFWLPDRQVYDTKNTGVAFVDTDNDGRISSDEATAQAGGDTLKLNTFSLNDINGDGYIDSKDAFIYYYTQYLDLPANNSLNTHLGISPDDGAADPHTNPTSHYYPTSQTFDVHDIPKGTSIIYVNGDINITRTDTKWSGGSFQHTIVATGNISIVKPRNGKDDTLVLISYGNTLINPPADFDPDNDDPTTGGKLQGNLIVCANGTFTAQRGGKISGAVIFANGGILIDTLEAKNKDNRTIKALQGDWSSPLGIPGTFPTLFSITFSVDESKHAVWERD